MRGASSYLMLFFQIGSVWLLYEQVRPLAADAFSSSSVGRGSSSTVSPPPFGVFHQRSTSFITGWSSSPPKKSSRRRSRCEGGAAAAALAGATTTNFDHALIFDCDGVIIETEELHRVAYNEAFADAGLLMSNGEPVVWSVEYYDVLQNTVGGGKNKMFFHFRTTTGGEWPTSSSTGGAGAVPSTDEEKQSLIDALQENKTNIYKKMISEKAVPRPGVIELLDEALADPTIAVGVCSASTKAAAQSVLDAVLGQDRVNALDVCILGDDVPRKKPDPIIYHTAAERLQIDPACCVVIEDSLIGLRSAKGAGMKCLITYTESTKREDFEGYGADAKVPDLGSRSVTLQSIFGPMRENGNGAEILVGKKDDPPAVPAAADVA